ncbi:MAG: hypothetical protein WKF37_12705 [Bryobacteraceae bacterium]
MMAARILSQIKQALSNLNPSEVREEAQRPVSISLHALSPRMYEQMENFFAASETLSEGRRVQVAGLVRREGDALLHIYEAGMPQTAAGFTYTATNPDQVVCDILKARPELKLALARQFAPFREQVVKELIWNISKENALFSVATAVPSMVPLLSLPWAFGEFASDTAFLTANQVRLAFMLAAASDRTVGYREQKAEIASVFAGAFGWRAIARELVGKIPLGGGLIPKAAISFAATYVVGMSLERLYRVGYSYTAAERRDLYQQALHKGKGLAADLVENYGPRRSS